MATRQNRPDDSELLGRVLRAYPGAEEVFRTVKQISEKANWPLNTFDDLEQALGGEDATVTFRGRTFSTAEVRRLIPSYYFPITSADDLIAKIADLQAGAGTPSAPPADQNQGPNLDIKWATPRERPQGVEAPTISIEEVVRTARATSGNTSGLGAVVRKG